MTKILILYGSETGNSQDIAERIWRQAKSYEVECFVSAMDDYDMAGLPNENVVIFVVSTTGQGDMPSNMRNSWRLLLRKALPKTSLLNVRVAVLGLGDSSYAQFNYAAKKLYNRLCLGLSAIPICELGLADDQHDLGLDAIANPWINNVWLSLKPIFPSLSNKDLSANVPIIERWSVVDSPSDISGIKNIANHKVKVIENSRVTPQEHFQDVRLLKLSSDELVYEPGDIACIRPENSDSAVSKLWDALNVFREEKLDLEAPVCLEQNFKDLLIPEELRSTFNLLQCSKTFWDLNVIPRRKVFEILASATNNELEKEKLIEFCTAEGQEELYNYCNRPRRNILEILADFPYAASKLSVSLLFEIFTHIQPRSFSIASSPKHDKGYILLLVAVVNYRTILKAPRLGLCSNWLANLPIGYNYKLNIKKGSLRFPKDKEVPVVMVAPGTGIAPFRSYLIEEICTNDSTRDMVLVFGCRNQKSDFYFKDDLMRKEIKLFTAFSRDQPHKIYVQHIIEKESEYFFQLIFNQKCWFYIAGSSKDMPTAVREAILKCLELHGQMTLKEAEAFVSNMERSGIYQTDTWC